MKKYILLLCLICLIPLIAYAKGVYYYDNPVSAVCSTDTDGVIYELNTGTYAGTHVYRATRIQLGASTYDITQYVASMSDAGSDTGNVRISLYIDDTDGGITDMPYTEIANSNVSVAMSVVGETQEDVVASLSSLLTGITGTIWLVNKEENSANRSTYRVTSGASGSRTCSSINGAIDSWSCFDEAAERVKIMGCQQ